MLLVCSQVRSAWSIHACRCDLDRYLMLCPINDARCQVQAGHLMVADNSDDKSCDWTLSLQRVIVNVSLRLQHTCRSRGDTFWDDGSDVIII